MKTFEPQVGLLEYLLSGESVLWVGAGASAEMGYPPWAEQAKLVRKEFDRLKLGYDKDGFEKFYKQGNYAAAFSALASRVGKKRLLVEMQRVTKASPDGRDSIYNTITKWPVRVFVTTNFDDEIAAHLARNRPNDHYTTVMNSESEIALLGEDVDHLVFKVHGSLKDDKNSVVTAEDYHNFSVGRAMYQKALVRLFKNKKVVIIGYGLGDQDVSLALEVASKYAKPTAPIYLILSDVTETDASIKKNVYNVKIIPYENVDGRHAQLGRILASYDLFLSKGRIGKRISKEARAAVPLFMFRNLNKVSRTIDADNYVLLKTPASIDKPISIEALKRLIGIARIDVEKAIKALGSEKLVLLRDQKVNRLPLGDQRVEDVLATSKGMEDVAYQNFIEALGMSLTAAQETLIKKCARTCLEEIFEKQGLELLHSIYRDDEFDRYSMRDMYEIIAEASHTIQDVDLRLAFIRALRAFVVLPNKNQRRYLVSLSQGYLMYHMMGRNKDCAAELKRIAEKDVWYVDSNVLQPLLAKGCSESALAEQAFKLVKKYDLKVKTTNRVILEVHEHMDWARKHLPGVAEFKSVAQLPEDDKLYNFFVAGYVNKMLIKEVAGFDEYLELIGAEDSMWIHNRLSEYGIAIEANDKAKSYQESYEAAVTDIMNLRKIKGTLSENPLQVPTDAELYLHMVAKQEDFAKSKIESRVWFLSSSGLFNLTPVKFKNWSIARFVRYVSFLSERWTSIDTLSDCLRSELCSSGIVIVDERNLEEYFNPEINTADLNLKREKKLLGKMLYDISELDEAQLAKAVDEVPRYMLPEFAAQLLARVNEQALLTVRGENEKLMEENKILGTKLEEMARKYASALQQQKIKNPKAARLNKKKKAQRKREQKQAIRSAKR